MGTNRKKEGENKTSGPGVQEAPADLQGPGAASKALAPRSISCLPGQLAAPHGTLYVQRAREEAAAIHVGRNPLEAVRIRKRKSDHDQLPHWGSGSSISDTQVGNPRAAPPCGGKCYRRQSSCSP